LLESIRAMEVALTTSIMVNGQTHPTTNRLSHQLRDMLGPEKHGSPPYFALDE
jgi:hypothetical protein